MAFVLRPPDIRESLTDKLGDLGRFRKRVVFASGLLTFIAVILGSIELAAGLDAAFHLSPLARAFALVAILTMGGIFFVRGITRPLSLRTQPLSVALELEQ